MYRCCCACVGSPACGRTRKPPAMSAAISLVILLVMDCCALCEDMQAGVASTRASEILRLALSAECVVSYVVSSVCSDFRSTPVWLNAGTAVGTGRPHWLALKSNVYASSGKRKIYVVWTKYFNNV